MSARVERRTLRLVFIAILGLAFSRIADAHRLDEYLQATRIDVEVDRIDLDIDLTPGAALPEALSKQSTLMRMARFQRKRQPNMRRRSFNPCT